ncbi:electron transport complex subunit RsxC [Opacimonas viscosa]|uniref:Ion-translocating oxidoreductase complex subunit C n=1 Tax=Opacimonas viscosa TaxID=2961944 RepID=A0AA41X4R2_9ALTE|nr:electron transport complex subunit RsxC [Opacimonas viscosa]MCP3429456.1 electron transport complex subunit RsxC [Opacimonas viscosa]
MGVSAPNSHLVPDWDSVFAQLNKGQMTDFPGGVHPPQAKALSNTTPIATPNLPDVLYIPIKQHSGVVGTISVSIGDQVKKGQALTFSSHPFSVPVHASTSGTITDIMEHPSAHASGLPETTIVLTPDGKDTWDLLPVIEDYKTASAMVLLERISDAGISGLGGAGFPTYIKTNTQKSVECIIINGIECEPYISSDDRIMREHALQIKQGIDILCHITQAKRVIVAVEDNKPEAYKALAEACGDDERMLMASVPTKYPAGGEKQLIQVLTGCEVPNGGLPIDLGILMYNVGTCFAIADAVLYGKALTQRVVTLTGQALTKPQNVWALLGTPIAHLLEHAGYKPDQQKRQKVIMGGPMMGFTVLNDTVPVVKITNCLLVPAQDELPDIDDEKPCIRCGVCADACPAGLLPQQLYWYSKAKELDKAQDYHIHDCIECGACAYVCPSEIPLVQYYRQTKAAIRQEADDKAKSDKAKERFEARQARLLADKKAREEKHRKAAEARKAAMENKGNDAKDKIAAALARAKAKRAAAAKAAQDNQQDDAN